MTTENIGYAWVKCKPSGVCKEKALLSCKDSDGTDMFVGRASYNGDVIPAKVMPEKNAAYIAYSGKEILVGEKENLEVLEKRELKWEPWKGGDVPKNAILAGKTSNGEALYVARASHNDCQTVGKLHMAHGSIYVPYGGKEHCHKEGEVLVLN